MRDLKTHNVSIGTPYSRLEWMIVDTAHWKEGPKRSRVKEQMSELVTQLNNQDERV